MKTASRMRTVERRINFTRRVAFGNVYGGVVVLLHHTEQPVEWDAVGLASTPVRAVERREDHRYLNALANVNLCAVPIPTANMGIDSASYMGGSFVK